MLNDMDNDFKSDVDFDDEEHFGIGKQRNNKFIISDESDCDVDENVSNAANNPDEINKTDFSSPGEDKSQNLGIESQDSLNITRFDTNELLRGSSQLNAIDEADEGMLDETESKTLSPVEGFTGVSTTENSKFFDADIYDAEGSSDEGNRSDSSSRGSITSHSKLPKSKKKKLDSIASDSDKSSSDEESKENSVPNESPSKNTQSEKLQKKTKRKVKNAVDNETDQIHSEAQKLVRESVVSLPYHIPKQRTLADFLNRRKATPVVPLRTSVDNLTKVWKALEEREKTAEEFYQSSDSEAEAENEEKKELADNTVSDGCQPVETIIAGVDERNHGAEEEEKVEEKIELKDHNIVDGNNVNNEEKICDNDNGEENTATIKTQEDLDKNNFVEESLGTVENCKEQAGVAEKRDEDGGCVSEQREQLIEDKTGLAKLGVPRLSALPGDFIDLDTSPAKGPVSLMHRFIKHVKLKPKQPTSSVSLSVLSTEVNEGGEVIGISEDVVTVTSKNEVGPKHRNALKKSLKLSVKATRDLLVAKKLQQHKFYEEEIYEPSGDKEGFEKDVENDLEEEEALIDEGDETEDSEEEEEEEEEEEDNLDAMKEKKREKNAFIDEEAEESEDECSSSNEAENVLETDACSKDGNNEVESTPILNGISQFDGSGKESGELLALCSGQFQTQPVSLSQLEISEQETGNDDDVPVVDQDMVNLFQNTQHRKVIDSDDEDSEAPKMETKRLMKLAFSDDEDSNSKLEINSRNDEGDDEDEDEEEEDLVDEEKDPVDEEKEAIVEEKDTIDDGDDEAITGTEDRFINDNSDDEISENADNEEDKNKEVHYNSEVELEIH